MSHRFKNPCRALVKMLFLENRGLRFMAYTTALILPWTETVLTRYFRQHYTYRNLATADALEQRCGQWLFPGTPRKAGKP